MMWMNLDDAIKTGVAQFENKKEIVILSNYKKN